MASDRGAWLPVDRYSPRMLMSPLNLAARMPRFLPAGSSWSGLRTFFAYHGVWAVGVRLLRTLSIRAKLVIVLLMVSVSAELSPTVTLPFKFTPPASVNVPPTVKLRDKNRSRGRVAPEAQRGIP